MPAVGVKEIAIRSRRSTDKITCHSRTFIAIDINFPRNPDEVTEDWLSRVLGEAESNAATKLSLLKLAKIRERALKSIE